TSRERAFKALFLAEFKHLYSQMTLEINYEHYLIGNVNEIIDVGIRRANKMQSNRGGVQITPALPCPLIASQDYTAKYVAPTSISDLQKKRFTISFP
ncbi:hypothetical protein DU191_25395, partial [Salmonella enterica subsp. enterica serovar Sandiego]|nr:hypothetical protein [Salmonella enterica subsp. enterica serovar Sandiego]